MKLNKLPINKSCVLLIIWYKKCNNEIMTAVKE